MNSSSHLIDTAIDAAIDTADDFAKPDLLKARLKLGSIVAILIAFVGVTQVAQSNPADPSNSLVITVVNDVLHLNDRDDVPRANPLQFLNPFAQNQSGQNQSGQNQFQRVLINAWIPLPEKLGQPAEDLFRDNSQSFVAKAVGSAEGTRRPDGGTNLAYYGHVDPGNAVWNVGTFSYQHCGKCAPEEADRRQLRRLAKQFERISQYAQQQGLNLTLEEQLNAIDLANQAPLAALATGGFIDRLKEAKGQGLKGSDAILNARVYAYKNPVTNLWEAPGLGNTLSRISHDQARRQEAIARTIQLNS